MKGEKEGNLYERERKEKVCEGFCPHLLGRSFHAGLTIITCSTV